MANNQQTSCRGAYSNMVNIFKNIIENMRSDMRKADNGKIITISDVSAVLAQLQNMINNTLYNLGYEVAITMSTLNESVNRNNKVRLSESQLHQVIKESVNRILSESQLNELDPRTLASYADKREAQGQTDKANAGRNAAIRAWNKKYAHDNMDVSRDEKGRKKAYLSTTFMPMQAPWNYEFDEPTSGINNHTPNDHYDIHNSSKDMFVRDKEDGGVEVVTNHHPWHIHLSKYPPHDEGEKVARQMYKGDGKYIPGKGWQ